MIAATVLGSGMAQIDATVVGIAIPTIGRDFHASVAGLQWVVTGYTLSLAALLLLGGDLGDRYGRRRIFSIGVIWFSVFSLACALSPGTVFLIVMRILQGVGAALLTPGSLAIIEASFVPDDRGRAIGAWSGLGGVATALGPLLGGYLIAAASWRWIFVINIPIGAAVLLMTARHVPESHDPEMGGHIDVAGSVLAVLALGGITYALIEAPSHGRSMIAVVIMAVIGVGAAVAFFFVERRTPDPLLPLDLFKRRQFSATNGVTFIVYAALGGARFLLPVELQVVNHYTALESGVALLPLTLIMLLLSARSGRLASRIGPRLQMSVGPIIVGAGLALLARATDGGSYWTAVLPAVIVFGLGLAATVAPLTMTALSSVPVERAGLASAVNNDVARLGSLIAVAVLPALAGITGSSYLHPSQLAGSFRTAMFISGASCAAAGVLAAFTIMNPERAPAPTPARAEPQRRYCALDATPLASKA